MMHIGVMKWFGSIIRKLTEGIGLYHHMICTLESSAEIANEFYRCF